jgi:hypothetical protein
LFAKIGVELEGFWPCDHNASNRETQADGIVFLMVTRANQAEERQCPAFLLWSVLNPKAKSKFVIANFPSR